MKYLVGNRASGVSTDLLIEASRFNGVLIVSSTSSIYNSTRICKELGIRCPTMLTFEELLGDSAKGLDLKSRNVYIDGVSQLFKELGLENVVTVGDTLELIKRK